MVFEEPPAPTATGLPARSGDGTTEEQIWRYVLRQIGAGIVDVELTSRGDKDPVTNKPFEEGETHQDDCLADARRWFSYRVGFKKIIQLMLGNNQSAYRMPDECTEVTDLWLPSFQLPTMDVDQFSYSYFTILFGQWLDPTVAPMPYSDLVQRLQYLEMIGKVFSQDRDYIYNKETRILEILPAPAAIGQHYLPAGQSAPALVRIWSRDIDCRQLDPMELDFFKRKVLSCALRTLGTIRLTFDSFPIVGSEKGMNGSDLMANADTMDEKLEQDVINWKRATPIIQG